MDWLSAEGPGIGMAAAESEWPALQRPTGAKPR